MSTAPVPAAFAGLRRLGSATYIWEPPSTVSAPASSSPDLIVLPAWLDAAPKHIAKYIVGYKALYPHTRLLIITSNLVQMAFSSRKANSKRVEPAVAVLASLPSSAGVLLHFFSNGGASTAVSIAEDYRKRTGHALPASSMVLDSAPGKPNLEMTVSALRLSLPRNQILHFVSVMILRAVLVAYAATNFVLSRKDDLTIMREALNNRSLFSTDTKRLYVYSKEDQMVYYKDVEDHAKIAEEFGYNCILERFDGSKHAAHMMFDPTRYWRIVKTLWDSR